MIVDCAYYERGVRQATDLTLDEAASRPRRGGNYVWIELREPAKELMADVGRRFGLHELAIEDAVAAGQDERPKVETYDDFYFIVFRSAAYDAGARELRLGEVDIFLGPGFVIAVRHGSAEGPERARRRLEHHPELLKSGPAAVVWGILDTVVDDFGPVLEGLEREIDDVERAIFSGREELTEQIYLLKRDVNDVYHAMHPLLAPLDALERGVFTPIDPGLLRYFRDVNDHVRRIHEEVLAQRDQLTSALEAHLSLIGLRQNSIAAAQSQVVRRLTIVATVFLPLTFITGFFGQNFAWLVQHVDTLAAFVAFGLGGLVIPCILFLVWFKRGGFA
jgi:magnesium transporter